MPAKGKSLESYTMDDIPTLKRRQLQTLCKSNGIKANSKSVILVKELQNKLKLIQQQNFNESTPNKENTNQNVNANKSVTPIKKSPIKPMKSPVKMPSKSPIKSPMKMSTKSPMKIPSKSPIMPIKSPMKSPIKSPMKSPIKSPMKMASKSPIKPTIIKDIIEDTIEDTMEEEIMNSAMEEDTIEVSNEEEEIIEESNEEAITNNNNEIPIEIINNNQNNGSMINSSMINSSMTCNNNNIDPSNDNTNELYTNHNISDISDTNINNGSLINNDDDIHEEEEEFETIIVSNATDISMNKHSTSSLSIDTHTPKLNESMEEFIRRSLNPQHQEKSESTNNNNDEQEDVDMEITPFALNRDDNNDTNMNASRISNNGSTNISMLGMNASRISINNESSNNNSNINTSYISNNSSSSYQDDTDEESWKKTPLKALQILDSIRANIKLDQNDNDNDMDEIMNNNQNNNEIPQQPNNEMMNNNNGKEEMDNEIPTEIMNNNEKEEMDNYSLNESVVNNLFYHSPSPAKPYHKPIKSPIKSHFNNNNKRKTVTPKSEVIINKNSRKISMTFGDGTTYALKSVYSPVSKSPVKPRRKSTSLEQQSELCSKTSIIRKMFEDEEKKQFKSKPAPDWNKIHQKQIFSHQPDLYQWNKQKNQRTQKLFGKMSTPTFKKRSQSMVGKKLVRSESKQKNNRKIHFKPSENDHIYNHSNDTKLNRKVKRKPTPYQSSLNRKASKKPRFSTSIISNSSSNSNSSNDMSVPKNRLAYDPDKVKSKLFENTKSMSMKLSNKKKRHSHTPLSSTYMKSSSKGINKEKNWSAVKSKVDSNNNNNYGMHGQSGGKVSGVKRKLSWSVGNGQPVSKKQKLDDTNDNDNHNRIIEGNEM